MSNMHPYSTDARKRLKILGFIAMSAYVVTTLISFVVTEVVEVTGLDTIYIVGLYSLIFMAIYWLYNNKLWAKFGNDIPDLRGSWVGFALPNYQSGWPHLAIVFIEQNWSEISIYERAFFKNAETDEWDLDKLLGYNISIVATLESSTADRSSLFVLYDHNGERDGQPNFKGAFNLQFLVKENKLIGNYFTNRSVVIENDEGGVSDKEGSQGPVLLVRLSTAIISQDEVLELGIEKGIIDSAESAILKRKQ